MNKLYEQLKRSFANQDFKVWDIDMTFDDFSHFVSMNGPHYTDEDNKVKLLLVGRATNGWYKIKIDSDKEFGKIANDKFSNSGKYEEEQFKWIVESGDGTLSNGNGYSLSTPFWGYVQAIWEKLSNQKKARWIDYIAWSNLYKVAPPDPQDYGKAENVNTNPTYEQQQVQEKICIDILKKEIETYKPTHILVVTGWDWFEPFKIIMDKMEVSPIKNISRGENKNEIYAEGVGIINDSKVVVACRPEYRDKAKYVNQIVESFNNL